MEVLQKYLCNSGVDEIDLETKIVPHFWKKGFKKIADFEYLEKQDLDDLDANDLTKRRLWKHVCLGLHPEPTIEDEFDQDTEIYIRYIFCNSDLFANDIAEMNLVKIKPLMKLDEITSMICSENKIPQEEVIELYSSHGYPLQNNEITGQSIIISWKLEDGDLFYVLRRLKKQPRMREFVSLPELDHCVGQETLIIETPFHGSFSVNAYCDSPEDIAQKVYSVTGIPVPFMSLYVRRGYFHEQVTAFTELKDQDHIRVILRSPFEIVLKPLSIHYGCQTYNFLVPQTKKGITKFFSILKFICSPKPHNKEYDFERFQSFLMTFTDFPPLVYALQNLKEFSFLTISGWTALIEGFYLLFKTILDTFATVSRDQIFEYSDYILSMFIHKSHDIEETCTETQHCSLVCPLSGTRIHQPVRVDVDMTQGPFDKENILAKIESDNNFEQFGRLTKEQLKDDVETAKLLMYFPWETDKKVCVWTNPPKYVKPPKVCRKVDVFFKWYDMLHSLSELHILNPQGLYGDECLTYNSEAHLIYFPGSTKSTDKKHKAVFYNACADAERNYQQVIHKAELEKIGNSGLELQVTSDIKKVIKKDSHVILNYDKIRKSVVISPEKSIQWETEEAVVILLDQRSSMRNTIFKEIGDMKSD
ncbi:PREDICTED: uncharacterized protein LOC109584963 isoform X1 [Amphimedon queenslandica]|uniref:Uncharacterized protein n=1 Tax=Amphimedon queenslandica TaxID=400682 RepID=A0AAN0JHI1_AMPQE|nr:PREDICTED: uncharacterized protein LOC109584963 isoform X1 [Amphimedon queenslandica]|eukprot:XP_019856429.1 PREDICTED: uncharacterized protein LOC109584963 isoform X1 [Amphimedon queenslandica]